jgi:uncharacterized protein YecT (DUF1311 family)
MRRVLGGLVAVALMTDSSAVLAQRSRWAEEACSKAVGHAESRVCFERWAALSLNSLVAEEKASRKSLAKADETPEDVARALAAFEDASQEYRHYREKQCNFVASLANGGNGAEDRRLLCQIELDRRRTANLREARNARSNMERTRAG